MIRYNLDKIAMERDLSIGDVMRITGISRNTVKGIWYNATKRIDNDTLNALCSGLDVKPADIIEYIPDME